MPLSVIIDANHCAYRVYHTTAGQNLRTRNGEPSGIIHGWLMSFCGVFERYKPDSTYVCWDRKSRHRGRILEKGRARMERTAVGNEVATNIFNELPRQYKESRYLNRTEEDHTLFQDIMIPQQQALQEILPFLGVRQFIVPQVEGDDLMGIITDRLVNDHDVVIISSDHDLYQLLGPNVRMYDPIRKKEFTYLDFQNAYSMEPYQFAEVKALMGDAGDDIPGVPGCGEKTACKLIREHGGVQQVIAAAQQVHKTAVMKRIPDYAEQIEMAYEMAYIISSTDDLDVDQQVVFEEEYNREPEYDWDMVREFTQHYELTKVWDTLKNTLQVHNTVTMLKQATDVDNLFEMWGDCTRCPLSDVRINLVKYSGPARAKIIAIGEAPGGPEDLRGAVLIGEAGDYFKDKLLAATSLKRDAIHVMNAVCCHPADRKGGYNRPTTPEELASCRPRLHAQIHLTGCKLAVVMGDKALKTLFPDSNRVSDERGTAREHPDFPGVLFLPVFHPSYLMRLPEGHSDIIKSRADWQRIEELYAGIS